MSWLDNMEQLTRDYRHKYRHLNFLRRQVTPVVMEKLTAGFNNLFETEGDRIFPKVNDLPTGARRMLHPKEKDHLGWLEVMRVNNGILSAPSPTIEEDIYSATGNRVASHRLKELWDIVLKCSRIEEEFIDGHLPTLTRLVSQCPGAWLDLNTYLAFRRVCNDLPAFLEAMERDTAAFRRFSREFLAIRRKPVQVKIIGVGEITTTIELIGDPSRCYRHPKTGRKISRAVKRMPTFPNRQSALAYHGIYDEYHLIIRDRIGIRVPMWGDWLKTERDGTTIVYNWQERLPQESIAALVIHRVDNAAVRRLFRLVLEHLARVFRYNASNPATLIGFDGQIPNWSVVGFDPNRPQVSGNESLIYVDTSTPLMRRCIAESAQGEKARYSADLLDTKLFLKSVPALIRPIIRLTFLQEVVDRYYDSRQVLMDLIASFYLYRRADMVPFLVDDANAFIEVADLNIKPYSIDEMTKYHKTDTMIWVFFRAAKRLDRWITEEILGKKYGQRLPRERFTPGPYSEK